MPVRQTEWRSPSLAQPKDQFGNENRMCFRATARLHDGHIAWRGWFEDRDDFDAFIYAMACGLLQYERKLWRLPKPWWCPDIGYGEELSYDFSSLDFFTTPTGSNQTYTSKSDWNNSNNNITTVGGGASGGSAITGHETGGGAGACNQITNFTFAAPGTTTATVQLATGGAAAVYAGSPLNGNDGNDTWFNGTTLAASSVGSKGGVHGIAGTGNQSGGAGGVAASGVGTAKGNGGRGGNLTGASGNGGSGGGGAGGPDGAGAQGVDSASTSANNKTDGGASDNGGDAGGTAGAAGGTNGGGGTYWQASPTRGLGGGGGGQAAATEVGGSGGNYGGGGGGVRGTSTATSGTGGQGLIAFVYTAATAQYGFNMPMMGM